MPEFVLNRKHDLRSTLGHIISFEKGKPTWVPPELVKEALNIGAEPVEAMDRTEVALGPEESPAAPQMSASERSDAIKNAFAQLERDNARGDFMASGQPKAAAVARVAGFTPESRELVEAWREYKEAKVLGA